MQLAFSQFKKVHWLFFYIVILSNDVTAYFTKLLQVYKEW